MLTETARKTLTQDLIDNIDYSYGSWSPTPIVYRLRTLFQEKIPSIGIQFLPTRERKFSSIGDIVGEHPDYPGEVFLYGYAELEAVRIFIMCEDNVREGSNVYHGFEVADLWARRIEWRIRRNWSAILSGFKASIEVGMPFDINDLTRFFGATNKCVYEITLYLRTSHVWHNLPSAGETELESGVYVEDAYLYLDDDAESGGIKGTGEYSTFIEVDT